VLGEVRAAVPGLPLIIDSGFRRGIDVVKAMALGAAAVMVGRVPLYGLAAGGEAGVAHALKLLRGEIGATLSLLGCNSLEEAAHCVRRTHGDRSP
jgi:isopentenyl diphosphate isomerase/L-lactate dehydrogenase-like FMN-dependent dehydrogenase